RPSVDSLMSRSRATSARDFPRSVTIATASALNSEVNSLRGRRGDWLVVMCSSFLSSGSAVYSNHDTPILGRDSQAPTLSLVPEPLIRSLGDRPFGILFCDRHGEFPQ